MADFSSLRERLEAMVSRIGKTDSSGLKGSFEQIMDEMAAARRANHIRGKFINFFIKETLRPPEYVRDANAPLDPVHLLYLLTVQDGYIKHHAKNVADDPKLPTDLNPNMTHRDMESTKLRILDEIIQYIIVNHPIEYRIAHEVFIEKKKLMEELGE